jgi:vacuolar-type H+-ATPase subunit C/Vma6
MFSPAPVAGYYVGKMSEIKTVRLILVCVLNGVAKEEIYRRLKENYA